MSPFEDFPILSTFVIIMVVIFLVGLFAPRKPPRLQNRNRTMTGIPPAPGLQNNGGQKICSNCGAAHPAYAAFCRHCGSRL